MINLGRIKISNNGKYIRGVKYQNAIKTGILLSLPIIIFNSILIPIFQLFYMQYPIIIFNVIALIMVFCTLVYTSTIDPGILPPEKLQEHFDKKLFQIFEKRSSKQQNISTFAQNANNQNVEKFKLSTASGFAEDSPFFLAINQMHDQDTQCVELHQKGHHIPFKYCSACRFFRPLRTVHSSRSNVCIQRYDHFCDWIGTDIGLHNHAAFIVMIYTMLVSSIAQLVLNILGCIFSVIVLLSCYMTGNEAICHSIFQHKLQFVAIQPWYAIIGLCFSLAFAVLSILYIRAINQLVKYHYTLLKSSTLTKEDSGEQNIQLNRMYNTFNIFGNFKLLLKNNAKSEPKILHLYCKNWNNIINQVKSNENIKNFIDLANFLKENGFSQQFNVISTPQHSMTCSRAMMMSEVNDDQKRPVQIVQVEPNKLLTRRSCFEYAINRSKNFIIYTENQLKILQQRNPELFKVDEYQIELDKLQLLELCQGKSMSAYEKANKKFLKSQNTFV